jgi:dihydroorotate dehydrogenase
MYPFLRDLLFFLPPEKAHHLSMAMLRQACSVPVVRKQLQDIFSVAHPSLQKEVAGLSFPNPVGLGAGFDKNALYLDELEVLGFGFAEIGTITPLAQPGNPAPRLFRLPKDRALINRMGFNNDGAEVVAGRLRRRREQLGSTSNPMLIGGNIGKNKDTPNELAWKDYCTCFQALFDGVDYFVVNVSSPNTPGLRALQDKESLKKILQELQHINQQKKSKPLLLKISPDLEEGQLEDIVSLAMEIRLDGLVATNTTISREGLLTAPERIQHIGAGGLSGTPLRERSTDIVKKISQLTGGSLPIIASGGVGNGADAKEKMDAGASLVQVWTGFIYEGPGIASEICRALATPGK